MKRHQNLIQCVVLRVVLLLKKCPLDISNIAILNRKLIKADRVGIKLIENEGKVKRVRFFKSNGSIIGA